MFHVTVWTDFGIPSGKDFDSLNEAHAHGMRALNEHGCTRYVIMQMGRGPVFDSDLLPAYKRLEDDLRQAEAQRRDPSLSGRLKLDPMA